jgi:hypothetical protein
LTCGLMGVAPYPAKYGGSGAIAFASSCRTSPIAASRVGSYPVRRLAVFFYVAVGQRPHQTPRSGRGGCFDSLRGSLRRCPSAVGDHPVSLP